MAITDNEPNRPNDGQMQARIDGQLAENVESTCTPAVRVIGDSPWRQTGAISPPTAPRVIPITCSVTWLLSCVGRTHVSPGTGLKFGRQS